MNYKIMLNCIVVLVVIMSIGAGCRSNKPGSGSVESLTPQVLSGDFGMADRFELGTRVPASEFSVEPVYFAYDSSRLAPSEKYKIERAADFLRRNRDVRLIVEGHCDERGSREYNTSLGEHRAQAIRAVLIGDHNVNSSRLQTRSYGEEMPVDSRHNESAWRRNRRGEFALYR